MPRKRIVKKHDDTDFEIRFMESLLQKNPDFVQALIVLGDLYTRKGFYQKGLVIDKKLSRLRPYDSVVFYNLACSYSLLKDIKNSFTAMKRAIKFGYKDFRHLESDNDLSNLRQDRRFQEYLFSLKKEYQKKL